MVKHLENVSRGHPRPFHSAVILKLEPDWEWAWKCTNIGPEENVTRPDLVSGLGEDLRVSLTACEMQCQTPGFGEGVHLNDSLKSRSPMAWIRLALELRLQLRRHASNSLIRSRSPITWPGFIVCAFLFIPYNMCDAVARYGEKAEHINYWDNIHEWHRFNNYCLNVGKLYIAVGKSR